MSQHFPEFESIKNIPGVVPEHPLEYFREMNNRKWERHNEQNGMFTFHFGEFNLYLCSKINYFRERCQKIQMATSPDEALKLRHELEGSEIFFQKTISQMRSDSMEYLLIKKEFAQDKLDKAIAVRSYSYGAWVPNYFGMLSAAKGYIQVRGGEITLEAIKNLLGENYLERAGYPLEFSDIEQRLFRDEFETYMYGLALEASHNARGNGVMTDREAKKIAFYLTDGETSDLRSLGEDFLNQSKLFPNGKRFSTSEIQKLYPRGEKAMA